MKVRHAVVLGAMAQVTAYTAPVANWYQAEPHALFPALPRAGVLKVGPLQAAAPQK